MRLLSIFAVLFIALQSQAAIQYVYGSGYSSGYCNGEGFSGWCVRDVQARAENDANRDADLSCRMKEGHLQYFSRMCNTFCSPSFIPNGQSAYVSCNARCTYNCEIPNKP